MAGMDSIAVDDANPAWPPGYPGPAVAASVPKRAHPKRSPTPNCVRAPPRSSPSSRPTATARSGQEPASRQPQSPGAPGAGWMRLLLAAGQITRNFISRQCHGLGRHYCRPIPTGSQSLAAVWETLLHQHSGARPTRHGL